MGELKNVEFYSKITGEELSGEIIDSLILERIKMENRNLYLKLNESPLDLTVDELEQLKKRRGDRKYDAVNLKYKKGYFMSSQSEEVIYEKLNELTIYLLHMCGYRMNKDGLLKYKNGRAIKKFKDLREYFKLSHYKWNVVFKDIIKYSLIKEQVHDDTTYLVVNPLYTSSQYEVSMYKFMAFHNELKDNLDWLDYLYLCKKFDIIP